jgi:hypothetical protein
VVDQLIVPAPLAGTKIDRDQALGEQVVPRTVTAVVIASRQFDRHVDQAELFVDAHLRPDTGIASVRPRIVQPRVVAELAGPRDGVENPEAFAGANVEAANVALDVRLAARRTAGEVCGPDDDHVARHDRRRMQADLAGDGINLLIELLLEIDDAVGAKRRDPIAGFRIERDQLIPGRHVEDSFFLVVGPVREAAPRKLARCRRAALPLIEAVHPAHLAGQRVERDRGAARARGEIQLAADHQRRGLQVVLDAWSEAVGPEAPRHLEIIEIARVDLIERRVTGTRQISAVGAPLAVLRTRLSGGRSRRPCRPHGPDREHGDAAG